MSGCSAMPSRRCAARLRSPVMPLVVSDAETSTSTGSPPVGKPIASGFGVNTARLHGRVAAGLAHAAFVELAEVAREQCQAVGVMAEQVAFDEDRGDIRRLV